MRTTEDKLNSNSTIQAKSQVQLGHGTVVDGDTFNLTATEFSHGAIEINSRIVEYGAKKNVYEESQEHKETYAGFSVSISSPLLERANQLYEGGKSATDGSTAGLVNGGVSVMNAAVGTVNGLAGNQRGANNDFYISANAGFTMSTQESKSYSRTEEGVVTTIRGLDENSSITYNNTALQSL